MKPENGTLEFEIPNLETIIFKVFHWFNLGTASFLVLSRRLRGSLFFIACIEQNDNELLALETVREPWGDQCHRCVIRIWMFNKNRLPRVKTGRLLFFLVWRPFWGDVCYFCGGAFWSRWGSSFCGVLGPLLWQCLRVGFDLQLPQGLWVWNDFTTQESRKTLVGGRCCEYLSVWGDGTT